jgi:hypothetical protein
MKFCYRSELIYTCVNMYKVCRNSQELISVLHYWDGPLLSVISTQNKYYFLVDYVLCLPGFYRNKYFFRLLTDFVCLYNYEFWLSLCKIARSSVILLLPLFIRDRPFNLQGRGGMVFSKKYILILVNEEKKSYSEFLSYNLMLN